MDSVKEKSIQPTCVLVCWHRSHPLDWKFHEARHHVRPIYTLRQLPSCLPQTGALLTVLEWKHKSLISQDLSQQEQFQQKEVKMFIVVCFCSPWGKLRIQYGNSSFSSCSPLVVNRWNSDQFSQAAISSFDELTIQSLLSCSQAGVRGTIQQASKGWRASCRDYKWLASTDGQGLSAASFFPLPVFHGLWRLQKITQTVFPESSEWTWMASHRYSLINIKCAQTKQISFPFRYYLCGS